MNDHDIQYFWERRTQGKGRSRFNLLLLEHGENFIEDVSVCLYPLPDDYNLYDRYNNGTSFSQCDALKIQGRLKLCSRSLIFEPSEIRMPLLKFPYKSIKSSVEILKLNSDELRHSSIPVSGFFTFICNSYFEMKANDTIGAYKQIDTNGDNKGRILFASLHSDISLVISKIEYLRSNQNMNFDSFLSIKGSSPFSEPSYKFDTSQLVDFHEKLLINEPIPVKRVRPLVINHGMLMITNARVYFQPIQLNNVGDSIQQFELRKIRNFYSRRYLLRQIGLEFILNDGSSTLFSFNSRSQRDLVYGIITAQMKDKSGSEKIESMTRKWQRKEISNFEYIMYLNTEADRSVNDLTQYPVFPHIISDYESLTLDLANPTTFRDLSRPIGALNKQRLQHFKDRFRSMPPADPSLGIPPPFLYGTHYSTPGYILFYLVRVAPEFMLCLQNGKFDAPDRMFHSVREMWLSCLNNPADLKELIPEFFTGDGDWLSNSDDLDLGHRQTGERVNDVELPPWAKNPRDFIRKHAKALESDYVSSNLNKWIDLIFGYKQQGKAAVDADNLYYYLTYEGSVDLEQITNAVERNAYEMQIQEFGQTPKQLFVGPHPSRDDLNGDLYIREEACKVLRTDPRNDRSASLQQTNEFDQDSIGIMHLDDDFRKEVARELSSPSPTLTVVSDKQDKSFFPKAKEKASQILGNWANNTTSFLDRSFNSIISSPIRKQDTISQSFTPVSSPRRPPQQQPIQKVDLESATDQIKLNKPKKEETVFLKMNEMKESVREIDVGIALKSIAPYFQREVDEMKLIGSEVFKVHKDITGISLVTYGSPATPFIAESAIIATCSKDSSLKVVNATISNRNINFSLKRTFSGTISPFSSCTVTKDGKYLYASSLDNNLYHYSIQNACVIGKKQGHDDGISCIDMDSKGQLLVTGSWDATVKVFELKENSLPSKSLPPFYMDNGCVSISIDDSSRYVAAGAEDGSVIVWDLKKMNVEFTYQLSQGGMMVSCVKWFPHAISKLFHNQGNFNSLKLMCSSIDGSIACIDVTGRVFAGARFEYGINALETDGRAIYGGLEDGSLRVWAMESGRLRELFRLAKAHSEAISSLKIDYNRGILASGASDGTIRLWNIT